MRTNAARINETEYRFYPARPDPTRRSNRSGDLPSSLVDIELHQAFVAHFQEQRLARLLIGDIGALHDFEDLERLLAQRIQDILAIVQHDYSPLNQKPRRPLLRSRSDQDEFDLTIFKVPRSKRVACHLFDNRPVCE